MSSIDIIEEQKSKLKLAFKDRQLLSILESKMDYVSLITPDGDIFFTSHSFFKINSNNLIGENFIKVKEKWGEVNHDWFYKLFQFPYFTEVTEKFGNDGAEIWVKWKNEVIFNEKNEIEYILMTGIDATEEVEQEKLLKYEYKHDVITGLYNLKGIEDYLAKNCDKRLILFYNDIKNHKNMVDFFGSEITEEALKLYFKKINYLKKYDCTIGRIFGSEYVIIAPIYEEIDIEFYQSLVCNIDHSVSVGHNEINLNVDVGYALYPDQTNKIDQLLTFADIAMFESKKQLSNCLLFQPFMYENLQKRIFMVNGIKNGLKDKSFQTYFQPIMNVLENSIDYFEVLARWEHETLGFVPPSEFLPIAEEAGLMNQLDFLIIEKALDYYFSIKKISRYKKSVITINISPVTLLQPEFPLKLNELLKRYKVVSSTVCIEINENTFVNNINLCKRQINQLRNIGVLIALDDFGRQYSSLAILNDIYFDIIKIDKYFIDNLSDIKSEEIIKMIIKISKLYNKIVIMEGVETKEQSNLLLHLGCFYQQGYYHARPQRQLA